MPHAKKCPHCGHVGSYEPAQLLSCESCGEVLAESWALGDAVTDLMEEGSWIHEFRKNEAAAPSITDAPPPPPAFDDAPPGMIGPGSSGLGALFRSTSLTPPGEAPKLPPFPPPETAAALLGASAPVAASAGAGLAGGTVSPLPPPPPALPVSGPRIVVGRPASDVAPPIFARDAPRSELPARPPAGPRTPARGAPPLAIKPAIERTPGVRADADLAAAMPPSFEPAPREPRPPDTSPRFPAQYVLMPVAIVVVVLVLLLMRQ